jgi:hypothetical protein
MVLAKIVARRTWDGGGKKTRGKIIGGKMMGARKIRDEREGRVCVRARGVIWRVATVTTPPKVTVAYCRLPADYRELTGRLPEW